MASTSIFIRARNEGRQLRRTLAALRGQQRQPTEVVVLDNESTDDTADVAREHGARVGTIGEQEFSYGRALNRCLDLTRGEIVVFLSAHSPPTSGRWLDELVAPIEAGRAAATFGRQVPEPGVNHLEEWILLRTFPRRPSRLKRWLGLERIGFSNANAAVAIDLIERQRFREDLEFAEDLEWARRVEALGHDVVYCPEAEVLHSHPYVPGGLGRRMEAVGRAMRRQGAGRMYRLPLALPIIRLGTMTVDLLYCLRRGYWRTIPRIAGYRAEYFNGLARGLSGRELITEA